MILELVAEATAAGARLAPAVGVKEVVAFFGVMVHSDPTGRASGLR